MKSKVSNSINLITGLLIFFLASFAFGDEFYKGKVVKVVDGDTLEAILEPNFKRIKIRLARIDAPERKQAFGNKSRLFLNNLIYGKSIYIKLIDLDRYGRYVSDVYLQNVYVNEVMVENGMAWVYEYFAPLADNKNLYILQNKAKQQKLGLWIDKDPVPPYKFRSKKSS